jgi:hypothetical protein
MSTDLQEHYVGYFQLSEVYLIYTTFRELVGLFLEDPGFDPSRSLIQNGQYDENQSPEEENTANFQNVVLSQTTGYVQYNAHTINQQFSQIVREFPALRTCPAHFIPLDTNSVITSGEDYKL